MKEVKRLTIAWKKEKRIKDEKALTSIELDLASITDLPNQGFSYDEFKAHISHLVSEHNRIIKDREETY